MTTRIWFDTEFIEDGKTIDLISFGCVREDGAVLYLENAECDLSKASPWVVDNVLPHLTGPRVSRAEMRERIVEFAGHSPQWWAYYASYDWVALCQLFGTMMDLPKGWPMHPMDLKQSCMDRGNPKLPAQDSTEHNALADAIWTRDACLWLESAPHPAQ